MQPLEMGFDQQATINLSMTRPHSGTGTPMGAFERRQSVSFRASPFAGAAAAPAAGQFAGSVTGPALQWTDSRKLLEAAIAMEQVQASSGPQLGAAAGAASGPRSPPSQRCSLAAVSRAPSCVQPAVPVAIPEHAGWGWACERDALAAEEARLQQRLWKLKLEHFVMEGDGNCQFRAVSFGLYGAREPGRSRACWGIKGAAGADAALHEKQRCPASLLLHCKARALSPASPLISEQPPSPF